jgi:hypothetical protein
VRFTRGEYAGSPEWLVTAGKWKLDADWNTRFPFGFCLGVTSQPRGAWSWCLDVNAPLGEPNRLYLDFRGWKVILGLPSMRRERITGQEGERTFSVEHYLGWPRVTRCDRYRYHQDPSGSWVRNDRPEKWHWGWLTVERS